VASRPASLCRVRWISAPHRLFSTLRAPRLVASLRAPYSLVMAQAQMLVLMLQSMPHHSRRSPDREFRFSRAPLHLYNRRPVSTWRLCSAVRIPVALRRTRFSRVIALPRLLFRIPQETPHSTRHSPARVLRRRRAFFLPHTRSPVSTCRTCNSVRLLVRSHRSRCCLLMAQPSQLVLFPPSTPLLSQLSPEGALLASRPDLAPSRVLLPEKARRRRNHRRRSKSATPRCRTFSSKIVSHPPPQEVGNG
jgi:hypothetical protein